MGVMVMKEFYIRKTNDGKEKYEIVIDKENPFVW